MQAIKEACVRVPRQQAGGCHGVSRTPKTHGSNNVYRRLRERGYDVFRCQSERQEVEGDRSYPEPEFDPRRG
jgi:hypothetical protein